MLTQDSINRTFAQMNAFGEGQHKFGQEGTKPSVPVPRDKKAKPKSTT